MRTRVVLVLVALAVAVLPEATGSAAEMCLGLAATKVGTAGAETINGTAGDDVIVGLGATISSTAWGATTVSAVGRATTRSARGRATTGCRAGRATTPLLGHRPGHPAGVQEPTTSTATTGRQAVRAGRQRHPRRDTGADTVTGGLGRTPATGRPLPPANCLAGSSSATAPGRFPRNCQQAGTG